MRMQSTAPTSFAIPNPFPTSSASAFDYTSYLPADYDWSKTSASLMDMDADHPAAPQQSRVRKLQFTGTEAAEELGGLGDLDISFESSPADDGKIRVRIHPPSTSSAPGSSASSSRGASPAYDLASMGMWDSPTGASYNADPFLGAAAASNDFGMPFAADGSLRYDYASAYPAHPNSYSTSFSTSSFSSSPSQNGYAVAAAASPMSLSAGSSSPTSMDFGHEALLAGLGSGEFTIPDVNGASGSRRRVRIALKSMPQAGGAEGGEWEVQIC